MAKNKDGLEGGALLTHNELVAYKASKRKPTHVPTVRQAPKPE